jgi:hypothetical protein
MKKPRKIYANETLQSSPPNSSARNFITYTNIMQDNSRDVLNAKGVYICSSIGIGIHRSPLPYKFVIMDEIPNPPMSLCYLGGPVDIIRDWARLQGASAQQERVILAALDSNYLASLPKPKKW